MGSRSPSEQSRGTLPGGGKKPHFSASCKEGGHGASQPALPQMCLPYGSVTTWHPSPSSEERNKGPRGLPEMAAGQTKPFRTNTSPGQEPPFVPQPLRLVPHHPKLCSGSTASVGLPQMLPSQRHPTLPAGVESIRKAAAFGVSTAGRKARRREERVHVATASLPGFPPLGFLLQLLKPP